MLIYSDDYIYVDTSTVTGTAWNTASYRQFCDEIYEAQYRREQQMWAEHQRMMEEEIKQAEELREDRRKYPLFFLKEGIV